jgi:16S rRNA (guanine527-N7)-methyltransferase
MPSLIQCREQHLIQQNEWKLLVHFVDLILEWNPRINLTGFKTRPEIEDILVGESILAAKKLPVKTGTVLDFGSGAGIPGLVWAIVEPGLIVTSVEVRQKKVAFQKEVVRSLRLTAEIISGRFPDAVRGRKFDVITTRAIRFSLALWKAAREVLSPKGIIVRFATSNTPEAGWESLRISERSTLFVSRTRD